MRRLIPSFILQKAKEKAFTGSCRAFVLNADIVGFTSLTQELMRI